MLILSGVFVFVGIAMILSGAVLRYHIQSQEFYRGRADGRVIELIIDKPDEEGLRAGIHHFYYPVIAYYANGLLYKVRYEHGSNPSRFHMNQEIKLCYNLEKPYQFKILERESAKILATAIYAAGFILCIAAGAAYLMFASR